MANEPPTKRQRLDPREPTDEPQSSGVDVGRDRAISPPLPRRQRPLVAPSVAASSWEIDNIQEGLPLVSKHVTQSLYMSKTDEHIKLVPSPIQLTRVEDLAPHQNLDAVGLRDILGDPMIKECWNFNFLFNVDFVMKQFDEDVRDIIRVKIIHGFWRKEDERRIDLVENAKRYPNIELLHAYIPDPFGTHHSKMIILFRHDGFAQVIIHTANMIHRDWANMTQAVWRSPLLPVSSPASQLGIHQKNVLPIGTGPRFKVDLLRYLAAYGNKLKHLIEQLDSHDFSHVRGAFIGSSPSRAKPTNARPQQHTSYGWLGLQEILSNVSTSTDIGTENPHIILQVSSIATLGASPTWLRHFQTVLSRHATSQSSIWTQGLSCRGSPSLVHRQDACRSRSDESAVAKFSIIFPTPNEIRTSLDGYASGGSIHMKLQSAQQQKQLEYLHPLLCHWKKVASSPESKTAPLQQKEALRGPAAPHIKTYVRFSDESHSCIDWALVTSANLSKQAWGDIMNKKDEIWIQSWEAGVVIWPSLFAEAKEETVKTRMVPTFGRDMPAKEDGESVNARNKAGRGSQKTEQGRTRIIGFRMPYDLPLSPYTAEDKPWCATMRYEEPDWKGLSWNGY